MVDFTRSEDVARWIDGRSPDEAILLAGRLVWRVLPALAGVFANQNVKDPSATVVLPVFRAITAPWLSCLYPGAALGPYADAADFLARPARILARSAVHSGDATVSGAGAVADAAASAAASCAALAAVRDASAKSPASRFASIAASRAANASIRSSLNAASSLFYGATARLALSIDATAIEQGTALEVLAAQPLWNREPIPDGAAEGWLDLKKALLRERHHWRVWTDWYEDRLRGKPPQFHSLELARLTLAEMFWEQGPDAVNVELLNFLEKEESKQFEIPISIDSITSQIDSALAFGGGENAPIDVVEVSPQTLVDTAELRLGHQQIQDKARTLQVHCGSSNRLAVLKGYATRLMDAAGGSLAELKLRAFWSAMNSLRRRLEADSLARTSADPETPPLPEEVKGALEDLLDELNLFAAHEPHLVTLDLMRGDPELRIASPPANAAVSDLISAAKERPEVVAPSATEALERVAADATGNSPSAVRARIFSIRSAVNLVLELIRRAYKPVATETSVAWKGIREGAYRAVGAAGIAGAGYGAALLIHKYETTVRQLADLLGGNQTLAKIIDAIVRAVS
ncbi:hypothetical protein [Phreatobacter sp.]|uniref:hypothetical protein n=1 Tax=Phreatobacter sp. TaxID=1966341 RepID=UPI0022C736B1|nr:hypothetical protein [Phreatobacter sp.]MCZ8315371.1 hypothetical protein [Phreatobacter sp.]